MRSVFPPSAEPCIWMSAGLLRYRLCDRGYDCAACPLDAALRGEAAGPAGPAASSLPRALDFPEGHLYSPGHCWLRAGGHVGRVGLDALASALLAAPGIPRRLGNGDAVIAEEPAVALDFPHGSLPLASPASGRALRLNDAAGRRPELVLEDPYGEGWLFEMDDPVPGPALAAADAAREQARLDLRRFGRQAALRMLDGVQDAGATLPDGGAPLSDLRRMLGPTQYLALLRELVR